MRDRETIAGHPWNRVNASWQVAWSYALQGDLDRAKPLADQAIELCRQWGFARSYGAAMSVLGHILVPSGRGTEAVELLEEGLRRTDAVGMTWLRCPRPLGPRRGLPAGRPCSGRSGVRDQGGRVCARARRTRLRGVGAAPAGGDRAARRSLRMPRPRRNAIARRRRSRARSRCAPSWRTATSGSVDCPSVRATARRPGGTLPSRRRCTARWTCGSGWSRRRAK